MSRSQDSLFSREQTFPREMRVYQLKKMAEKVGKIKKKSYIFCQQIANMLANCVTLTHANLTLTTQVCQHKVFFIDNFFL